MSPLIWAIVLLLAALILVVLEVLIPSLGALGALAVAAVVAATFMAYEAGGIYGAVILLVVAAVLIPLAVVVAFRLLPHTPLGDIILNQTPSTDEMDKGAEQLKKLVGQRGVARSKMLPSGDIRLEAGTFDAVSDGSPIEAGDRIVVVSVRTQRLVVRALSPEEAAAERLPTARLAPDDVLSRPIGEYGIDPLELPPAREGAR